MINVDNIDQQFMPEQKTGEYWARLGLEGKWVVRRRRIPGYLHPDGHVRRKNTAKGWFDTYADVLDAYAKWLKMHEAMS